MRRHLAALAMTACLLVTPLAGCAIYLANGVHVVIAPTIAGALGRKGMLHTVPGGSVHVTIPFSPPHHGHRPPHTAPPPPSHPNLDAADGFV